MRLISMTDFVLNQGSVLKIYINHLKEPLFDRCVRYANFLKESLKLEMFIGDKALFEGWVLIENTLFDENEDYLFVEDLSDLTIENLIETVTLTQHAIKQLGI